MQQQITIETIESKEFTVRKSGYDQDEVDAFLDDICDELERQINTINKLQQELRQAQSAAARPVVSAPQPAPAVTREGETAFREILEMAQKVKDETIAKAQEQAEAIVEEARQKAEEQLGSLTQERDSLTAQIEGLKKTVTDYRSSFEDLLSEQKAALERIAAL